VVCDRLEATAGRKSQLEFALLIVAVVQSWLQLECLVYLKKMKENKRDVGGVLYFASKYFLALGM
jgi:heme/copper-type cytochrome/quinol oxidase subunit 4